MHRNLPAFLLAFATAFPACAQSIRQPYTGEDKVTVQVPSLAAGYMTTLNIYPDCAAGAKRNLTTLKKSVTLTQKDSGSGVTLQLNEKLKKGQTLCAVIRYKAPQDVAVPLPDKAPDKSDLVTVQDVDIRGKLCNLRFNDCDWGFTAVGGVEQSDTSAQTSQVYGFVDLFLRGPRSGYGGSLWSEIRLLGSPSNSNTNGISAASTDPTGNVTASTLSTVGYAIDYIVGYQYDFRGTRSGNRSWSLGTIVAAGATTPLSSQNATVAYAVPPVGSAECAALQNRILQKISSPSGAPQQYQPPYIQGPISVTTTTTTNGVSTTTDTKNPVCITNTAAPTTTTSTLGPTTQTVTTDGTQVTNIAFAPEDRSQFLLKWIAGLRFVDRRAPAGTNCHGKDGEALTDTCSRSITDLTIGQDEAIAGGHLKTLVFKLNTIQQIPHTQFYVFGSAAVRVLHNRTQDPLLLTATPVSSLTIPSPSVYVLPLTQSNRDFYRIGIGLELSKLLPKLFGTS